MKLNRKKIFIFMAEQELTQVELSRKADITSSVISKILACGRCHLKTAGKIAKALDIPVEEIVIWD